MADEREVANRFDIGAEEEALWRAIGDVSERLFDTTLPRVMIVNSYLKSEGSKCEMTQTFVSCNWIEFNYQTLVQSNAQFSISLILITKIPY